MDAESCDSFWTIFGEGFKSFSKCISQTIWIETTVILSQRFQNSFQLTRDIVLSRLHKILGYLKRFLDVHCHRNPWIQFNIKVYVHRPSIEQALNTTHSCHPSNPPGSNKGKALTNSWVICCNKVAEPPMKPIYGPPESLWNLRVKSLRNCFFSSALRNRKRNGHNDNVTNECTV